MKKTAKKTYKNDQVSWYAFGKHAFPGAFQMIAGEGRGAQKKGGGQKKAILKMS